MRYSLSNKRIAEGVAINEILFGQGYEVYQRILSDMDIKLNFNLDDYYICLIGMPKRIYSTHFDKSLEDFLRMYSILREDMQNELSELDVAFDIAVIKYDESKRICCMLSIPPDVNTSAMDIASSIHDRLVELYEECWDLDKSDYVCVTALSSHLSGFDALQPGFREVRNLSELFFFAESSGVMTSEIYQQLHKPLDFNVLAQRLKEIESCLVRADVVHLDLVLQKLFLSDVRYSYNCRMCDYVLVEIIRLTRRYDEVFLANIDSSRYEKLSSKGYLTLDALFEEVRALLRDCATSSLKTGARVGPISLEAVQYLRNNYDKSFTVKAIARHIGVSPNYLSQVFNKEIGESIPAYSTKIRLHFAMLLIKNTDSSIAAIGKRVGFNNAQYFNHIFRQKIGITPAQYREKREGSFTSIS